MSEPEKIEWKDVEKAMRDVASLLDDTAKAAKSPERKAMGENLAAVMRQGMQEMSESYIQAKAAIAAEQANLESAIQAAMAEQQKAFDAAQKTFAELPKSPAPAQAAVPEANPGPRLRRELLDRYGKRGAAKSGEPMKGFDTWLGSSSVVPADSAVPTQSVAPAKPAAPADDLEQAWMPYFTNRAACPPAPATPTSPAPAPPAKEPPKKPDPNTGSRGWATWMDDSGGSGSVNT